LPEPPPELPQRTIFEPFVWRVFESAIQMFPTAFKRRGEEDAVVVRF
jgi:hypothetical protein